MKQVVSIYKKHKHSVDMYLTNLVKNHENDLLNNCGSIFSQYRCLQLLYTVDENYIQTSPVISKKSEDSSKIGTDKSHYFQKMVLNNNIYISNPYIHYKTGKASVSLVYLRNHTYYILDIGLIELLEEMKLIEFNRIHDKFKRSVYLGGSTILAAMAVALIGYGTYVFVSIIFFNSEIDLLHDIFKSIISVTLGLAIFDLAKQIFEHEVLFQTLEHDEDKQYKVLGRFLVSIIVALSIETLLVVFKSALAGEDGNLLSAFFLIIGTTAMFVGLGWFYKTIKLSGCEDEKKSVE